MNAKAILVPSAEVKPVNQLAGTITLGRLETAMELWRTGQYNLMILSGGFVQPKSEQTLSHAEIMREWMLSQDRAPADNQIIVENQARDTYQNAFLSGDRIEKKLGRSWYGSDSLTITTEKHHGKRFLATFKSKRGLGWHNVAIAPAEYPITKIGCLIEWALLLMHILDPAGNGLLAKLNRKLRAKQ